MQSYAAKNDARGWLARRTATTLPLSEGGKGAVSSFAYQGTNSHVIVGAPQGYHALVNRPQRFWDHRKFWFQVCLRKLNFGSGSLFSLEDMLRSGEGNRFHQFSPKLELQSLYL